MKKIKKPISIFLSLILILSVFTIIPVTTAGAENGITYIDADGEEKTANRVYGLASGINSPQLAGWFAVTEDTEISSRIICTSEVYLILCDGATLTAPLGISVNENASLTIYGQRAGTGALTILYSNIDTDHAALGGDRNQNSSITINGGVISIKSKYDNMGALIGGGYSGDGTVTINGGVISVESTYDNKGALIGGGTYHDGTVTINGGTVTATSAGKKSASIGGGYNGTGTVTINGGSVTASTIGNGEGSSNIGHITLNWTQHTDSITVGNYYGTVTLQKHFCADRTVISPGRLDNIYPIIGKTLTTPYEITWKDWDGTPLRTDYVPSGSAPAYDGDTPTRAPDDRYVYTFSGWSPAVVPATEDAVYTATYTASRIKGHSLTLDGDIGINYFFGLTDDELAGGAVVDFAWTVEGEEKTASVTLTAADKTDNGCKATCPVAVAEMTCDVAATLTVGGEPLLTDTYSVKRYADTILTDDYRTAYLAAGYTEEQYGKLETLVKTMLDYGAKAQLEFDRNIFNLANKGIDYDISQVTADMIISTSSDMNSGLHAYGLKYEGSTIVYLSKTSMRHYYTITDQTKFDAAKDSITFDGVKVDPVEKNGKFYFEKINIAAADLDTPYTLTIGTNDYNYTVLDYVRACLSASNAPVNTKRLVCATYWYNQAANAYFGR